MFEVVHLGGIPFLIPIGADESKRREAFFAKVRVDPRYAGFRPSEVDVLKKELEQNNVASTSGSTTSTQTTQTPQTANTATTVSVPSVASKANNRSGKANKANKDNQPAKQPANQPKLSTFPTSDTLPPWMPKEDRKILLRPEEYALLDALGVNEAILKDLASYLPAFFDSLPSCSTDTTMMLKRECEEAYYVLWSIQFALQKARQAALEDSRDAAAPVLKTIMDDAIRSGLDGIHVDKFQLDPLDIYTLFTIGKQTVNVPLQKPGGPSAEDIRRFFTLLTEKDVAIMQLFTRS